MGDAKITSGIITTVSAIASVVGYWGAHKFVEDAVKQNLFSDLFGAGIVLTIAFAVTLVYELIVD